MSRESRYIDRRLVLTGSAIALLAAACGSDGGASNPLSEAATTTTSGCTRPAASAGAMANGAAVG